jgi:tRNA pseudouridine55 synthase
MARSVKPGTRPVSGILIVDKPSGETSNRTLQRTRRLFGARKAGHTGTLDPMATGMLPICFGSATRVSGLMLNASKRYRVTARFGSATDTGDANGTVISESICGEPGLNELEAAVASLRGPIRQVPPMYSALRHQGRHLYELARKGQVVEREARLVEILEFEIESRCWPEVTLHVHCSKGTYVRSLVTDLAAALGSVAHVSALRRLAVGPYGEELMRPFETLEAAAEEGCEALDRLLLGIDTALMDRPAVTVSSTAAQVLCQGQRVQVDGMAAAESVRVYAAGGSFIGLGQLAASGELKPAQIFVGETLG